MHCPDVQDLCQQAWAAGHCDSSYLHSAPLQQATHWTLAFTRTPAEQTSQQEEAKQATRPEGHLALLQGNARRQRTDFRRHCRGSRRQTTTFIITWRDVESTVPLCRRLSVAHKAYQVSLTTFRLTWRDLWTSPGACSRGRECQHRAPWRCLATEALQDAQHTMRQDLQQA